MRFAPSSGRPTAGSAVRFLPYFLIPAAGAISPLVVLPAITRRFGADGWSSVAIAMALGGGAAIIAENGWGVLGPQRVAASGPKERLALYRSALAAKTLTTLPLAVLAAAVCAFVVREHVAAAVVLTVATAFTAYSPSWYFVGVGRPWAILTTESLPRLLVSAATAAALLSGAPLMIYSLGFLATVPVSLVVARAYYLGIDSVPTREDFARAPSVVGKQSVLGAGRAVSVVYTALPPALVGIVAPEAVASFSAVDRLLRMALTLLSAVPTRLQSWVGSAPDDERLARSRMSLRLNASLGVVAGLGFALSAPLAAHLIFSGTVDVPKSVVWGAGLLIAIICGSRGQGLSLVAKDRANAITYAIVPAAVVGLLTIGPLSSAFGAAGAITGEVLAESTGVLVQAHLLTRAGRKGGRATS